MRLILEIPQTPAYSIGLLVSYTPGESFLLIVSIGNRSLRLGIGKA
jgi:hypothetical protein